MLAKFDPTGLILPDFYIVGVMKGGTSSSRFMLGSHPDIFMPGRELHWFDKDENWSKGLNMYSEIFKKEKSNGKIIGEKTPKYMNNPINMLRLKHVTPNAKLIIFLRCPTNRWFSHYYHDQRMFNTKYNYEEAFYLHQNMIARGMYLGHLQNIFSLFPLRQVHIEYTERMRDQTKQSVTKMLTFLEVDPDKKWHTRKRSRGWSSDPEWRARINEIYRPMLPDLKDFLDGKGYDVAPINDWCQD